MTGPAPMAPSATFRRRRNLDINKPLNFHHEEISIH